MSKFDKELRDNIIPEFRQAVTQRDYYKNQYHSVKATLDCMSDDSNLALIKLLNPELHRYLRDPIWGNIPLPMWVYNVINHPIFLRLKNIKQLMFVCNVYPGAQHSRFEHSIGVYELTRRILYTILIEKRRPVFYNLSISDKLDRIKLILAGALLHDIGHYPFCHLLETKDSKQGPFYEKDGISIAFNKDTNNICDMIAVKRYHQQFRHNISIEEILKKSCQEGGFSLDNLERLKIIFSGNEEDIKSMADGYEIVRAFLQGPLEPDRIEYFMRDSYYCGVNYGNIDYNRLIDSIDLGEKTANTKTNSCTFDPLRTTLVVSRKGIPVIEQMILAKYQMYKYVYWHHASDAALCMMRRILYEIYDRGYADTVSAIFGSKENDYLMNDNEVIDKINRIIEKENDEELRELYNNIINRRYYYRAMVIGFVDDEKIDKWKEGKFKTKIIPDIIVDSKDEVYKERVRAIRRMPNTFADRELLQFANEMKKIKNVVKMENTIQRKLKNIIEEIKGTEVLIDTLRYSKAFKANDVWVKNSETEYSRFDYVGISPFSTDISEEEEQMYREIRIYISRRWEERKKIIEKELEGVKDEIIYPYVEKQKQLDFGEE